MKKNQLGFGAVGVVITLVVLLAIGGVGWFVFQNNKTQSTGAANDTSQDNDDKHVRTEPKPTVAYLDIKEWGVKLALSEAIKDAYYVVPLGIAPNEDGRPSGIIIGLASLDEKCGKVTEMSDNYSNAFGGIVRVIPDEKYPLSEKTYREEYPIGVIVGDYYYGYGDMTVEKTCETKERLNDIAEALKSSTKSIER